jgi:hypothetical protein
VLETFNDAAVDGTLFLGAFEKCFEDFVDESQLEPAERTSFTLILPALYELFDADGDGTVRFALSLALALSCSVERLARLSPRSVFGRPSTVVRVR